MNGAGVVFLRVNTSDWSLLNMWLEILILGTESSSISYTHQTFEYRSFFSICHWQAVIYFLMGVKSWVVLAAVQEALEGKHNQMEKYTWILSSQSCFSLIVILPINWVDVKRWLTNFHPLPCGWGKINTRSFQRNNRLEEGGELDNLAECFGKLPLFMLYLPLIFTNMYSTCGLPFY